MALSQGSEAAGCSVQGVFGDFDLYTSILLVSPATGLWVSGLVVVNLHTSPKSHATWRDTIQHSTAQHCSMYNTIQRDVIHKRNVIHEF